MHELAAALAALLATLLDKGGPVVVVVMLVSVWMWALIGERFWFIHRCFPSLRAAALADWQGMRPAGTAARRRLRQARRDALAAALDRHFGTIRSLTAVLPLLGLLGTVTGMITAFDLINVFGNSNPRELSRGIDHALVSTISGLVTAISGLYFVTLLEGRARRAREQLGALLV